MKENKSLNNEAPLNHQKIIAQQAVALRYQSDDLPRVVAKGKGYIAQQIIQIAETAGIPQHQDPALAQALSALEIQEAIPRALFEAVAQVLIFAFDIKRQQDEAKKNEQIDTSGA
jgi:flagellar biosynthesis protein